MIDFKKDLTILLNKCGWDTASETPDHILADYVEQCLYNYCLIIRKNIVWHNWEKVVTDVSTEKEDK